ncbi:MAG TPA: glycosyltransferase family 4 protein [Methanocella sp.]|uniref:glycosyltransferase family 4 protein n=1 Tax=Methanocella sp. TaxID=2052833 RepID=UPI002C07DB0D|nr:glycosyltransferase family 4 protein [Methanocella sp.]HTY91623.1 glycosyltransferase family 4 protein [Methanocella sp.]
MESLRIGMFAWESLHGVKVGGLAPHVSEISEALAHKGHEVHVFTRRGDCGPYDEVNGVHYQRVKSRSGGSIVSEMDSMCDAFLDRYHSVRKLFGEFDVLHGHDWHPVTALTRLRKKGRDFVMTYHSIEWGRNGNRHSTSPEAGEISHREWLGGYEAKKLIVTSKALMDELQLIYSIPSYKLNLVPNGIFPKKINKEVDPAEVKMRYKIEPESPLVLFVGRMKYQKGPDLLVKAVPHVLKKSRDSRFVFAGDGDMRPFCEAKAHSLGVSGACRFPGYVPDGELVDLFNSCNMLAVPSRNEPFGIVVLEAWDACKPPIGTDAVGIIDNFVNGIKARPQPESLAWCISDVVDKPGALKWMGMQGKKLVDSIYDWNNVVDELLKVYDKVA